MYDDSIYQVRPAWYLGAEPARIPVHVQERPCGTQVDSQREENLTAMRFPISNQ